MKESPSLCVIGAGVVGLHTATLLQEALPHAKITIIAEKFLQDTTSDGAAGIYRPSPSFKGSSVAVASKWLKDSYDYFKMYLRNPAKAHAIGIKEISGHIVSMDKPEIVQNHFLKEILPDYRECTKQELASFPGPPKYGTFFTTLLIECRKFMPYLQEQFVAKGGKIIKRRIESFEELCAENFDLVFNCSGLGSQKLSEDSNLVPVRGQVFKVIAPWVTSFVYNDFGTYIIPGFDAVTLGGVRQYEDYNLNVEKGDSASIMKKCVDILPSLKDAKVLREWVGLRPHRGDVRVEAELWKFSSGKSLTVVHNYGHGGYGVMSAPGTSMDAVNIGVNLLKKEGHVIKAKL